jgi:DnaJ-class molecular chaperone
MKKRHVANPDERECTVCDGKGTLRVIQPVRGRRIYPPRCKECDGRGRVKVVATS